MIPRLFNDQPWIEDALCRQVDPEIFYPENQGCNAQNAKRVCRRCPVRAVDMKDAPPGGTGECLEYALEHNEQFGVWGGLTPRERQRLRRERPRPAPAPRTHCVNGHELAKVGQASNGACRRCRQHWDRNRRNGA